MIDRIWTVKKALAAFAAFLTVLAAALEDGRLSESEWVSLGGAAGGVVAVWALRNAESRRDV